MQSDLDHQSALSDMPYHAYITHSVRHPPPPHCSRNAQMQRLAESPSANIQTSSTPSAMQRNEGGFAQDSCLSRPRLPNVCVCACVCVCAHLYCVGCYVLTELVHKCLQTEHQVLNIQLYNTETHTHTHAHTHTQSCTRRHTPYIGTSDQSRGILMAEPGLNTRDCCSARHMQPVYTSNPYLSHEVEDMIE